MRFRKVRITIFATLILLYSSNPILSLNSGIEINVDPRIELLAVIQSFTDWPRIGAFTTLNFKYYEDVKSYFAPHKDHAAVKWFNINLKKGWNYDAPPQAMLYLSSPPEMKTIIPFSNYLLKRGRGSENLGKMINLLNQFVVDSHFMRFWNEHKPFYMELIKRVKKLIPYDEYSKLMMNFYGEEKAHFVFIAVPLFHRGGYGAQIETEKGKISHFFGGPQKLENGFPTYNAASLRALAFHEFGHSFVDPIVYAHASQLNKYKDFYQYMKKEMSSQAYGSWLAVCNEHLVRTGVYFLLESAGFPEESKNNYKNNLARGFKLLPFFKKKMETYVNNRDKYPSFRSFFPEIIKVFEEVKPILSEKPGVMGFTYNFINGQCEITTIVKNSPFHKFGVKKGDILLYIDDTEVTEKNFWEAVNIWKNARKGDKVKFTILRDNEKKIFEIEVPFIEYYKFVKKE